MHAINVAARALEVVSAGWGAGRVQVAFSRTGDVFVADGYCNSRVMQYSADGAYVGQYRLQNVGRHPLCLTAA